MFPIANFASVLFLTLFSSYRFLESHGNNNQVALILLLLTLLSIRSEKDWLSALLLSLATVIKLTPAIFILYFLFEKRYKVLFFFMGFMIIWIILPGLFLGMEYNLLQWQNWKELVLDNAMKNPVFRAWKNNQSLVATLAKYFLLVDDPDSQTKYNLPFFIINPITLKIINYSLSLSIIVPLFIRLKNGLNKNSFIAALFILSAVFSGISWIHSFVILLYPMYYLFARFSFVSNSKEKTLSYIFYFIVFIIFISSGFISRDLENIFLMYSGFLYISIGLYTILLLLPEKKIV
jgi:hypothetical protein